MKKLLNFALIVIALSIFVSCEKNTETDIEIIEDQLNEFVSDKGITKCSIILMSGENRNNEHIDVDFSISNGFVIVKGQAGGKEYQDRFNLLYLSRYILYTDNTLGLYFASTH